MTFTNRFRVSTIATASPSKVRGQRGVALFITLLLLSIVSLLGLAMMLSVNSDMMINGYYGNYRSSFYAADSGLTVARQALLNNIQTNVNLNPCTAWGSTAATGCTSDPLSGMNGSTLIASLKSTYSNFTSYNPGGSWPASFIIADNGTVCQNGLAPATGSPSTTVNGSGLVTAYTYTFNYTLCATGRAQSLQQVLVKENGSFIVGVQAQTSTSQKVQASFASFGAFIDNFSPCQAQLVAGTITGPAFTNGAWNWGTGGSYIYTDPVGQSDAKASYWFGSTCQQVAASSDTYGGQTVKPTFQQGFNLGQPAVTLPANDFSQQWAVLDGIGCGEGGSTCGSSTPPAPTNANLNSYLSNINGTAYPTGGTSSGVYLPYCKTKSASCSNPMTVTGGGIYVQGNASIVLKTGTDTASPPNLTQIYQITQGSTVTTVTTNIGANTTTIASGTTTTTLTGVPENLSTGTASPATMLYVNGTITGLSGSAQGVAAVQNYSQITIAAASNIDITGDLLYAKEPVTENTTDSLIAGNNYNQVLGIFTSGGDINLSSSYSNGNLETDASLAAINSACTSSSSSSSCGFSTSGNTHSSCGGDNICTWTIVGGRIESNAHSVSINAANTYFDRRFTSVAGFAPPWFPSTSLPEVDITNALPPTVTATQPQRLSWVSYPQ